VIGASADSVMMFGRRDERNLRRLMPFKFAHEVLNSSPRNCVCRSIGRKEVREYENCQNKNEA